MKNIIYLIYQKSTPQTYITTLREIAANSLARTREAFRNKNYDEKQFFGAVKQRIMSDAPKGAEFRIAIVYNVADNANEAVIAQSYLGVAPTEAYFPKELPAFSYIADPTHVTSSLNINFNNPTVKYAAFGTGIVVSIIIAYYIYKKWKG